MTVHRDQEHMGERQWQCNSCERSFTLKGNLRQHVANVHLKLRPHQCPVCKKRFGAKHGMDDHVLAVHLKRKPYGCSQCSYRSAQRSHLRRHQRDVGHTGDIMLPGNATGYGSGASSAAGPGFVGGDGSAGIANTPSGGIGSIGDSGVGSALSSAGPAGGVFGGGLGDGGVGTSSSRPAGTGSAAPAYVPHLGGPAGVAYYTPAHQQRGDDDAATDRQAGEDVYSGSDGQDGGTETEEDMPPSGARRGGPPAGR